jgi:hypothetical protein
VSLQKLLRLSARDRSLLRHAIFWVAAARLALWALPFDRARSLLTRGIRPPSIPDQSAERIGWAVAVAKQFVPKGNCLPQALAAEALLLRCGRPVEFRIGVVKTGRDRLEAHAWVESQGFLVVGDLGQDMATYSPLPRLPSPSA